MSNHLNTSKIAEVIRTRRSVKKGYTDQVVEEKLIHTLLDDAIWAPNHKMREPWRFIFVDKDNLPTFAKKIAATYAPDMQQNREDYLNEPNAILVVIMQEEEKQKQWEDNYAAVAGLIQNFSLLAWEQQLGVVWKTNPHIYDDAVKEILNVKADEKIVGFLHLGYFDEEPLVKERTPVTQKFTRFEG